MNVKNSVVFITGANRGIGLSLAREALARGAAKVYAGTRNPDGFSEQGLIPVKIDVTDLKSIAAAAKAASDVTILINNAGIAGATQDLFTADVEAEMHRFFETNFYGMVRTTNAFVDHLPSDGRGAIVNVLSDVTWRILPILTSYSATKAAAWSYTNNVRAVLKPKNIQVLGLHVGFVDTDLTKSLDVPKTDPKDVARLTLDALEAGKSEVFADAQTLELKKSLSDEQPCYLV
jgi:NAD(P)-dependent dehydrogenase (short-subunit alcohol dehydrogenase family)